MTSLEEDMPRMRACLSEAAKRGTPAQGPACLVFGLVSTGRLPAVRCYYSFAASPRVASFAAPCLPSSPASAWRDASPLRSASRNDPLARALRTAPLERASFTAGLARKL